MPKQKQHVEDLTNEIYRSIIDETTARVKADFVQEGVDEHVVEELRKIWEQKLCETGVVGPDGFHAGDDSGSGGGEQDHAENAKPPAAHPLPAGMMPSIVMPTMPGMPPMNQHQFMAMHHQMMMAGIRPAMPLPQPGAGGNTTTSNIPPLFQHHPMAQTHMHMHMQQQWHLQQQQIQQQVQQQPGGMALGAPPATLAVGAAAIGTKRPLEGAEEDGAGPAKTIKKEENTEEEDVKIPQRDGPADEEADTAATADVDDDGEEELGEDDDLADVDDHEDVDEEAVQNVVIGSFEKVHRSKAKWRLNLKNCVANINGREYLLKKVTGDLNFS